MTINWTLIAVISQIAFTAWFALTHWFSLPPLNDLSKEAFPNERRINIILHVFQLASIVGFIFCIKWLMWLGALFWTLSLVGHITSWWLPYFFGWPKAFLKDAAIDNAKTYHFLPERNNHPIPDLNHCVIGVLCTLAFISSWSTLVQ
jgi:hypothetical protein